MENDHFLSVYICVCVCRLVCVLTGNQSVKATGFNEPLVEGPFFTSTGCLPFSPISNIPLF